MADGSPHVRGLIDEMVEDSPVHRARRGRQRHPQKPAAGNLRERAVVMALRQMGALVLYGHVKRLLGIDLLDNTADALLR